MPEITAPSPIVEAWASPYARSIWLSGVPGSLLLTPDQIRLSPSANLSGFASNYEGCQEPIRRVCRAVVRELGADRVLYFPDSGWPRETGDLCDTRFDDIIERLTAWGPPVSEIGALPCGRAVRGDYHYADGALRRRDGTAVSEAEIVPGYNWISSGEIRRSTTARWCPGGAGAPRSAGRLRLLHRPTSATWRDPRCRDRGPQRPTSARSHRVDPSGRWCRSSNSGLGGCSKTRNGCL